MAMKDGLSSVQTEIVEFIGDGSTLIYDLQRPVEGITTVENWETGSWTEKTIVDHWSSGDEDDDTKITFVDNNEPGASVAGVWVSTFETAANMVDGDFVKVYSQAGIAYNVYAIKTAAVKAKYTFTFEAKASTDSGDYFVLVDTNGARWAASADITGSDEEPTSSFWVAIDADKKVQVDISGDTDAASVAASFEAAIDGLTGFSAVFTSDDTADDGTMFFEAVAAEALADPEDYSIASESDGTSGMTWAETVAGVDVTPAPSSSAYVGATGAGADITGETTAADVAAVFVTSFEGITDFTDDFTLTDNVNGTVDFTLDVAGDVSDPEDYATASESDGTSAATWAEDTEGKTTTLKVTFTGGNTLKSILNNGLKNGF